jgi:hypothetical protein
MSKNSKTYKQAKFVGNILENQNCRAEEKGRWEKCRVVEAEEKHLGKILPKQKFR